MAGREGEELLGSRAQTAASPSDEQTDFWVVRRKGVGLCAVVSGRQASSQVEMLTYGSGHQTVFEPQYDRTEPYHFQFSVLQTIAVLPSIVLYIASFAESERLY